MMTLWQVTDITPKNQSKEKESRKERRRILFFSLWRRAMAGPFDKRAELYLNARPNYPEEWFFLLASRTLRHSLAWDVSTGNGQAAVTVAENYNQVIGTDIYEAQLKCAIAHPRVRYLHTPLSHSEDDLITQIGGENLVNLVTVVNAVHWFDLSSFYSAATRALRKPGEIIALWGYSGVEVDSTFDPVMKKFHDATLPYWDSRMQYVFDGYKTLPFPFESVGLGSEGEPFELDIPKKMSFEWFLGTLRTWSAVAIAREKGVDLLPETGEGARDCLGRTWLGGVYSLQSVCARRFSQAVISLPSAVRVIIQQKQL